MWGTSLDFLAALFLTALVPPPAKTSVHLTQTYSQTCLLPPPAKLACMPSPGLICHMIYRVNPGRRNWQIETAAWIWPSFFHCALETRWLGVRKTCGIGLFYRNYRPLLQETGWLGSDFISVCLETRWLGQKPWFLSPGTLLYHIWYGYQAD
jgi:hypothetical protein